MPAEEGRGVSQILTKAKQGRLRKWWAKHPQNLAYVIYGRPLGAAEKIGPRRRYQDLLSGEVINR